MKQKMKNSKRIHEEEKLSEIFIMILISLPLIFALGFADYTEEDFNNGTYFQTFYNSTLEGTQLNTSYFSGNYTSKIFDGAANTFWVSISWLSNIGELLNNQQSDVTVNMTGNVLLMHFNNDLSFGENESFVYDFSGNGNNGNVSGAEFNSTEGKFFGAFVFNGTEQDSIVVQDSDSLDLEFEGAIEFWLNFIFFVFAYLNHLFVHFHYQKI